MLNSLTASEAHKLCEQKTMTRTPSLTIRLWLRVIVCFVVANLLFSVGEGLQLRPFGSLSASHSTSAPAVTDVNGFPSTHHLNPMEATAIRKSDRRNNAPIEIPPVINSFDSHISLDQCADAATPSSRPSFYLPAKGRAPPLNL